MVVIFLSNVILLIIQLFLMALIKNSYSVRLFKHVNNILGNIDFALDIYRDIFCFGLKFTVKRLK